MSRQRRSRQKKHISRGNWFLPSRQFRPSWQSLFEKSQMPLASFQQNWLLWMTPEWGSKSDPKIGFADRASPVDAMAPLKFLVSSSRSPFHLACPAIAMSCVACLLPSDYLLLLLATDLPGRLWPLYGLQTLRSCGLKVKSYTLATVTLRLFMRWPLGPHIQS